MMPTCAPLPGRLPPWAPPRARSRFPAHGFARIELVIAAIGVGFLVAFAISRYLDQTAAARMASVANLRSAAYAALTKAHLAAVMTGQTGSTGQIALEGQPVTLAYGYPVARQEGIGAAVATTYVPIGKDALIASAGASAPPSFLFGIQGIEGCTVPYTEATASAPALVGDPTGC